MTRPFRLIIALSALALCNLSIPANAFSNATKWLMNEQIGKACQSGRGRFDPQSIFEVDLNGDGRKDLVLAHEGIECQGQFSRSMFCGVQVCSILVYYREGKLLKLKDEFLGLIVGVKYHPTLSFDIMAHGGAVSTWYPTR